MACTPSQTTIDSLKEVQNNCVTQHQSLIHFHGCSSFL